MRFQFPSKALFILASGRGAAAAHPMILRLAPLGSSPSDPPLLSFFCLTRNAPGLCDSKNTNPAGSGTWKKPLQKQGGSVSKSSGLRNLTLWGPAGASYRPAWIQSKTLKSNVLFKITRRKK